MSHPFADGFLGLAFVRTCEDNPRPLPGSDTWGDGEYAGSGFAGTHAYFP